MSNSLTCLIIRVFGGKGDREGWVFTLVAAKIMCEKKGGHRLSVQIGMYIRREQSK